MKETWNLFFGPGYLNQVELPQIQVKISERNIFSSMLYFHKQHESAQRSRVSSDKIPIDFGFRIKDTFYLM
jgi:hypothetical protein